MSAGQAVPARREELPGVSPPIETHTRESPNDGMSQCRMLAGNGGPLLRRGSGLQSGRQDSCTTIRRLGDSRMRKMIDARRPLAVILTLVASAVVATQAAAADSSAEVERLRDD